MTRPAAATPNTDSTVARSSVPAALHIFKAGRHVAMDGQAITFSEADIAATCAAYDPAKHEAPLTIGHPQHDLPAYGWVAGLTVTASGMDALPAQVDPAFAEMHANGRFKKISASFYSPTSPQNPVPGCYYLRHVGFLGAQPPAVKGLRSSQFADAEEGVVNFGDYDDATNAGLWRNLRELLLVKFGPEETDRYLPNFEVRALELGAQEALMASAAAREVTPIGTSYADPATRSQPPENPPMDHEQILADITAENMRLKAELAANKAAQVHAAHTAFCEAQPGLAPKHLTAAVAMLDQLAAQETPVNFGEGEDARPLADAFKALLTSLPALVEFGELATGKRAAGTAEPGHVNFSAPQGYTVNADQLNELGRAKAYQAAHKVDLVTAVNAVRAGQV